MVPKVLRRLLFCVCVGLISHTSMASEQIKIESIEIEGLKRTEKKIVLQELSLEKGRTYSKEDIEAAVNRVRNTQLFEKVTYELRPAPEDSMRLLVLAKDRWTTIPIAKFASGGGVTQFILGLYDPNIAGEYLEAGGQYERLGETNSGVVWFRNPRILGQRLSLFVSAWHINRLRTKYNQDKIDPEPITGFLHKRTKYSASLTYELNDWARVGILGEYHDDSFSTDYVEPDIKELVALKGLPVDTKTFFTGIDLSLGQINYDAFLASGFEAKLSYLYGNALENGKDFTQYDFTGQAFFTGPFQTTLAQRVLAGATDTETLQYWYYLGGLDRIRGFQDNRIAGRYFVLSNTEVRIPSFRYDWLVLQNVLFHDVAAAGENPEELKTAKAASVGTGLRFILPKVYRFVARLDYAKPILRNDTQSVSFGVQQFF